MSKSKSDKNHIITKYFNRSITSDELDFLTSWLDDDGSSKTFRSFVHTNYAINYTMGEYNSERTKKRLLETIRKEKSSLRRLRVRKMWKYAAVAIVFLGIGLVYQQISSLDKIAEPNGDQQDKITLKLSDGSTKVLSGEENVSVLNNKGNRIGLQNGNQLIYHKSSLEKKLVYNTLKIPYGKRFMLILSDGTKVHLNAGTVLKYPIQFIKGKYRQVFLEGEAFFDVAKDRKHPFVVNTNEINIKVLGTQFNLSAYAEDTSINTVLVEGSVGFFENGEKFDIDSNPTLNPGFMASWKRDDKSMSYDEVDTQMYTGWIDGRIIFNHIPFNDIIKKLERNYDVQIINNNNELGNMRFTASFDTETIEQVLNAFKKSFPLHFKHSDTNQIIIE